MSIEAECRAAGHRRLESRSGSLRWGHAPPDITPVRRAAAGLLRRPRGARRRRAVPGERHPRAAASRASGSRRWASTTTSSAAARRSTTRTATLLAASARTSPAHGLDLPVYWGNRNWDPYLTDAVAQMKRRRGHPGRVLPDSAPTRRTPRCRQYRENLADAAAAVEGAPRLDRLRAYFNHPRLRRAGGRRHARGARRAARRRPRRRAPGVRHPLHPRSR